MVIVNFKNCQGKEENTYIEPFAKFLVSRFFPRIEEIDIESPEDTGGRVDYFIPTLKVLVEVKQVVNKEWQQNYDRWEEQVNDLNTKVNSRDLTWVRGYYRVIVPFGVKLQSQKKVRKLVDKILDAVRNGERVINLSRKEKFEIYKSSRNSGAPVSFGGSLVRIESDDIIRQSTIDNIKKADKQLGSFTENGADKRILLLVDVFFPGNVFPYPAVVRNYYTELLDNYKNIDEIWLQVRKPSLQHHLLFSRNHTREEMEDIWCKMEKKYLSYVTSTENDVEDEQ